jgi:urease subunit gamma
MHLTPREADKLTLYTMAMVAERRLHKGVKLNHPETVAFLSAAAMDGARAGLTVEEVMSEVRQTLSADQVMDGVPDLLKLLQIECVFSDGSRLVSVYDPIS